MGTLFPTLAAALDSLGKALGIIWHIWYFILPPILFPLFKQLWPGFVWGRYAGGIKWILLEIIPPRDIEKSPLPMESIFAGIAGSDKSYNIYEQWVRGEFPSAFSLEIASHEGQVHFYVRTQSGFRNLVEAHFYAQYPDIEIVEVPDYVTNVPRSVPNKDWDVWGTDFELTKPDLYPIRTYKYFEESVTGKMIDPLAGLIETMSKAGPGQHMWLQYIIVPQSARWYDTGKGIVDQFLGRAPEAHQGFFERVLADLRDVLANLFTGLFGGEMKFAAGEKPEKKEEQPVEFRLTPGEKDVLKALQENLGKQMFSVRMRYVYIGRREGFSKPTGVSAFIGGIKQFNDNNLNSFKPEDTSKTDAKYLFVEERLRFKQRRILNRYMGRDGSPDHTKFIMSTEELATVFHIPDMSVTAPALTRVAAKRGGAPANLPIQVE